MCTGIQDEFLFLGDLFNALNKRQGSLGQAVTLKTFNPDRHASNLGLEDLWSLSQSLSASSRIILQLIPRSSPTTLFPINYLVIMLPFEYSICFRCHQTLLCIHVASSKVACAPLCINTELLKSSLNNYKWIAYENTISTLNSMWRVL